MTSRHDTLVRCLGTVSRETLERLDAFAETLKRWNPSINLVSPSSIDTLWERHITDSAQLWPMAPRGARRWVDLGTGGGFPGLICAILGAESPIEFHLVESDRRKATFLREAARVAGVSPIIHSKRIEQLAPLGGDVVSARALAPLVRLLPFAARHCGAGGTILLLKGRGVEGELTEVPAGWHAAPDVIPSRTDPQASILRYRSTPEGEFL